MSDSPMRSSNVFARFRKDLDDLKRLVKQLASAPISHASITGPVVVGHRGTITAPSPTGGETTLDSTGVTSTDADGKGVQVGPGEVLVQAGPDEPWVPLEQAILEQVPPASDGLPPASSPLPVLTSVRDGFVVSTFPVVNADPVTVDVFMSTSTPVEQDEAHRVASIENGGTFPVSGLLPRTDYFFVAIARDVDGFAPASAEVAGQTIAPSDGQPPSTSPTPVLVGGFGVMYVRLPTIPNADPVTEVRVYASAISPITTDATIVGRATNGGTMAFSKIGGTALAPGTTYYVRTVAADVDGDGPLSPEASGSVEAAVDQSAVDDALAAAALYTDGQFPITETKISDDAISTPKLRANAVTAAKVAADVMVVNDFFARNGIFGGDGSGATLQWTPASGLQQTFPDGSARFSIPSDPTAPNVMRGDATLDGLTTLGRVSIRGTTNEISRDSTVTLATGTTAPTTSLIAQNEWPVIAGSPVVPANMVGLFRDGTRWVGIESGVASPRLVFLNDSGAVTFQPLPFPDTVSASRFAFGAVKVGSSWHVLASGVLDQRIYQFDSSFASTGSFANPSFSSGISTDGTDLYVSTVSAPDLLVTKLSVTGTVGTTTTLTRTGGYAYGTGYLTVLVGSFDFGATRYVGDGTVSNTSGVAQAAQSFTAPGPLLGWDGTRFVSGATGSQLRRASTLTADRTLKGAYSWFDSDTGGTGTHETNIGQIVTINQKARSGLRFTTPPPADDGSTDAPNSAKLYLGLTDATLKYKGSPFVESTAILDFDFSSGTAPVANSFLAGVAGRIESANGSAYIAGDGSAALPQLEARVGTAAKARANHTGTQTAATISDFAPAAVSANVSAINTASTADRARSNHTGSPAANWSNGNYLIRDAGDPLMPTDVANKRYVDTGGALSHARRVNTVAQLTSPSAYAKVLFQTAETTHADISYSAGNFTLNAAGLWEVTAEITFDAAGTGFRQVVLFDGASNVISAVTMPSFGTAAYIGVPLPLPPKRFPAGQVLWVGTYQVEGSLNLVPARSAISIVRIGA